MSNKMTEFLVFSTKNLKFFKKYIKAYFIGHYGSVDVIRLDWKCQKQPILVKKVANNFALYRGVL